MRKRHKLSLKEGIVLPDYPFAASLGFTSDKFGGYLWKDGKEIWVPVITSKQPGKGNLSRLFRSIQGHGYSIMVPTPFGNMQSILVHLGFHREDMPWEPSKYPVEESSPHMKGAVWQRHKMAVVLKGGPVDTNVQVWVNHPYHRLPISLDGIPMEVEVS